MSSFGVVADKAELYVSSTHMIESDKMRIWKNRAALMNNLGIDKILLELTQHQVFTAHENHAIRQKKSRMEQTQHLLDLLQEKGGNSFDVFVAAVEKCHPALRELLQSDLYQDDPSLLSQSPDITIYPSQEKNRTQPNEVDEETQKLQFVNGILKKKVKEIIQVNLRWQAYKEQSDDYIRSLLQQLEAAESQAVNINSTDQQDTTETLLNEWKEKLKLSEEANEKLEEECEQLNNQLAKSQSERENSEAIIRLLQDELDEQTLQTSRKPDRVMSDDKEKITVLEQQLHYYKEDFEQERRERQNAEIRQQELEHELLLIKEQPEGPDILQEKTKSSLQNPRDVGFTPGGFTKEFHNQYMFEPEHVRQFVRSGFYQADGSDNGEDEADGQSASREYSSSSNHEDGSMSGYPHDYTEFTTELAYIEQQPQYESD